MQLCVLVEQRVRGTESESLCIVLIKVCDGGLENVGSRWEVFVFSLGGHTENPRLLVLLLACAPYFPLNSAFPCASIWGWPLLLFLFYLRPHVSIKAYFSFIFLILCWCEQWRQFSCCFAPSIPNKYLHFRKWNPGWILQPWKLKGQSLHKYKWGQFAAVNHNFSWNANSLKAVVPFFCLSLCFQLLLYIP